MLRPARPPRHKGRNPPLTFLEWPVSEALMRPAARSNNTTTPSAPAVATRPSLPGAASMDSMPPCVHKATPVRGSREAREG